MNVGTALGLHKVIPGEEDLPSLPKIDTRKKRKQPKKTPSLPQAGQSPVLCLYTMSLLFDVQVQCENSPLLNGLMQVY